MSHQPSLTEGEELLGGLLPLNAVANDNGQDGGDDDRPPPAAGGARAAALVLPVETVRAVSTSRVTPPYFDPFAIVRDPRVFSLVRDLNGKALADIRVEDVTAKLIGQHFRDGRVKKIGDCTRRLSPERATQLLGELAYLYSCLYLQAELQGLPVRRYAESLIPGIERTMWKLAERCGLPPRDSARTVWIGQPAYSWTREPSERVFAAAVRGTASRLLHVAEQLEATERGRVSFENGAHSLTTAADALETWRLDLSRALRPGVTDRGLFRKFLAAYPVCGELFDGPSPVQLEGWQRVRESIGSLNSIRKFGRSPLLIQAASLAGLAPAEFRNPTRTQLRRRLDRLDDAARSGVEAVSTIVRIMNAFEDDASELFLERGAPPAASND
ncbi:hypothetical protein [Caulobacter flavus]|uniref:hypothetical protein n=1 Tax=Caulobacter flavus TaxID=1679497 RepID=UPI0011AF356D|nr:hypothetical protein [Caulobacter flavus]